MAGRPRKTEGERKMIPVRMEKDIALELEVYASLRESSLSDVVGEQVIKWWESSPDREDIKKLVQKRKEETTTPPKKQSKRNAA